jgi:esterase/lipase superfamily enzyme
MRMKQVLVVAIILLIVGGIVVAATPSIFEMGLVNSYSISDISESEFSAYTPGVRMTFYVNEWFGLSGEALLIRPFVDGLSLGTSLFYISTDLVFRWPLGFFEPYFALGPTYSVRLGETSPLSESILYNAKVGFDFNITPVFALGAEAGYVANLGNILNNQAEIDLMQSTVGLVLKLKL